MDQNVVQEMLHEMFASLEVLDTQTAALRQFLKDKGLASDQELAPYLEQAGNASSVRWLALRVRIESLLASAMKPAEQEAKDAKKDSPQPAENKNGKEADAADKTEKEREKKSEKKDAAGTPKADTSGKSEADQGGAVPEKDRNQENEEANRTNDNATKNAA
jgi:hypothetical protein